MCVCVCPPLSASRPLSLSLTHTHTYAASTDKPQLVNTHEHSLALHFISFPPLPQVPLTRIDVGDAVSFEAPVHRFGESAGTVRGRFKLQLASS